MWCSMFERGRLFHCVLAVLWGLVGMAAVMNAAHADERNDWLRMGTQTCVQQAPNNSYVSRLNLPAKQLTYSCYCVVRDMLHILSDGERQELLRQMQQKQNLSAVAEKMFERSAVKNATMMCSAASYWQ